MSSLILARRALRVFNRRLVSTSPKKNETAATAADACKTESKAVVTKNWVSYGFDTKDQAKDRAATHITFFTTITCMLVIGGFYLAYMPDYSLRDWSQREAFLELRRREKNGLPRIDPNFINPASIVLPSDDELAETEIII